MKLYNKKGDCVETMNAEQIEIFTANDWSKTPLKASVKDVEDVVDNTFDSEDDSFDSEDDTSDDNTHAKKRRVKKIQK